MQALNRRIRGTALTALGSATLLSAVASILHTQPPQALQSRLAIVNVAVIDATGSAIQYHKTVLVAGNHISAIVDAKAHVPKETRIIRGDGRFLIPGLWDMHVHLSEADLPILVAYGVTGVRDMGNVLANVDLWRGRIAAGGLVGPRIIRVGPILNGIEYGPVQLAIENEPQARTAVRVLKKVGVDAGLRCTPPCRVTHTSHSRTKQSGNLFRSWDISPSRSRRPKPLMRARPVSSTCRRCSSRSRHPSQAASL